MTGRGPGPRVRGLVLAAAALALNWPDALAAPLTQTGRRAYEAAQKADDGAGVALDEGEKSLARVRGLVPAGEAPPEALRPLLDEAAAAHEALVGYRRLAQASAADALRLLADVSRLPVVPALDVVRRDTLEQHALLAAHEAAVMAARARAEAERLRAIAAEARLAAPGGPPGQRGARGTPPLEGPAPAGGRRASEEVVVPNLVGARLDAAIRDLQVAGLRLGTVTGPREGFVVLQAPDAGASVPGGSAVSVTLSATAATIGPPR